MGRKKVVEVVIDDEIIDNPEEVTIEEVVEPKTQSTIIETGVIVNGKREFKNTLTGTTFIED